MVKVGILEELPSPDGQQAPREGFISQRYNSIIHGGGAVTTGYVSLWRILPVDFRLLPSRLTFVEHRLHSAEPSKLDSALVCTIFRDSLSKLNLSSRLVVSFPGQECPHRSICVSPSPVDSSVPLARAAPLSKNQVICSQGEGTGESRGDGELPRIQLSLSARPCRRVRSLPAPSSRMSSSCS